MMNVNQLWQERFQSFMKESTQYLYRIANGFMIVPVVLVILGSYYYPQLVDAIPDTFPMALVFTLLFALLLTFGEPRTFIISADLLFLPHIEGKLGQFFVKSLLYSWGIQGFLILSIGIALSPLYTEHLGGAFVQLFIFIGILLVMKGWNLTSHWQALKLQDQRKQHLHKLCRFIINGLFLYGLLKGILLVLFLALLAGLVLALYDIRIKASKTISWPQLIAGESRLNSRFYKWINLFVDVPHLQDTVKYRRYLPGVSSLIPFKTQSAYRYLYIKMFMRSHLFSQVIRLTIVGAVILYFIPNRTIFLIFYGLFLLFIGMQLRSFWSSFSYQFWTDLYPIPKSGQKRAFVFSTFIFMAILGVLLVIPRFLIYYSDLALIVVPLIGVILSFVYCYIFLNKKITV